MEKYKEIKINVEVNPVMFLGEALEKMIEKNNDQNNVEKQDK